MRARDAEKLPSAPVTTPSEVVPSPQSMLALNMSAVAVRSESVKLATGPL